MTQQTTFTVKKKQINNTKAIINFTTKEKRFFDAKLICKVYRVKFVLVLASLKMDYAQNIKLGLGNTFV